MDEPPLQNPSPPYLSIGELFKDFNCLETGGWPVFALHHSHGWCPVLAFFARACRELAEVWAAMLPSQLVSFYTHSVCRRRTRFDFAQGRLFAKYAKDGHSRLLWLLQFEGRPAEPTQ
jgi:hypothetical protein